MTGEVLVAVCGMELELFNSHGASRFFWDIRTFLLPWSRLKTGYIREWRLQFRCVEVTSMLTGSKLVSAVLYWRHLILHSGCLRSMLANTIALLPLYEANPCTEMVLRRLLRSRTAEGKRERRLRRRGLNGNPANLPTLNLNIIILPLA